jgi:O-antigen/teichoic acid export membrane protein
VAIYGLGQFVLYAGPMLLFPLYARCLAPSDFGALTVLQRVGDVLTLCLLFNGFRQAIFAVHGQSEGERRRRVAGTVVTVILGVVLIGLAAALSGARLSSWGLDVGPQLVVLASTAALAESSCYVLLGLSQAREESSFVVAGNVTQLLLRVVLAIGFVVGLGWGAAGALLASTLASGAIAVFLVVREAGRAPLLPDWSIVREMASFSLPFLPGGLSMFLLNNGDRFLVLHWHGKEAVGVYDLGYRLALAVYMLSMGPLQMVWGTRLYQSARQPGSAHLFGRTISRILMTYTLAGLGVCLFADEAVALLGAGRYPAAAEIVPPVALACWFLGTATLADAPFYIRRRTGLKTVVAVTSAVVVLACYRLLIPAFGGPGAAFATLIGFAFQAALTRGVGQRLFAISYEDRRLVGALAIAVALWGISRLLPATLAVLPAKVFLWAMYPMALWAAALIRADEAAWMCDAATEGWLRARTFMRRGVMNA